MLVLNMLIKRNLLIYFRNKSAVFFSLLASIITLCLYLFFINDSILKAMEKSITITDDVKVFLNASVICGVISLNTFTIPLSFMNIFTLDREKGVLKDFFVSPVKRATIMFSYVICSVIATLIINIIIVGVLFAYLYMNNALSFTLTQGLVVLVYYLFSNCLFSVIAFFIANFVKDTRTYGNIIGLSSALVGFLSGIYMPIGNFGSKAIETVISLFPITQLNSFIRQVFMDDIFSKVFAGAPSDIVSFYQYYYGIVLKINEVEITLQYSFIYLFILFVVFTLLSVKFLKASK